MVAMNTLTSSGDFTNSLPQYWDRDLFIDAMHKSFWSQFWGSKEEGSRARKPIQVKSDLTKEPGERIKFTALSRLRNAGVTGHSTLEGNEGEIDEGSFYVDVDWVRNGIATDKKTSRAIFWDFAMRAKDDLSDWAANYLDWKIFDELINQASPTTLYANNRASASALTTTDTFGSTELDQLKLALTRRAKPIMIKKKNGRELAYYGVAISDVDEYHLKADNVYRQAVKDALPRGEDNPIFDGATTNYNGLLIYVHYGLAGDMGTPLRPECQLYGTHLTTQTTTLTVGADATVAWNRYFPASCTLCVTRASDGAIEFISVSAKPTANTFTITSRGATYGTTTSVALDLATGDKVTLGYNESWQIAFGAQIMCLAWAKPFSEITNVRDFGFERGYGIEFCYGCKAYQNSAGANPNYVLMKAYSGTDNPNI